MLNNKTIKEMKATEVFNLIAKKEVQNMWGFLFDNYKFYAISPKQYAWLVGTLCKEFKSFDGTTSITWTDEKYTYILDPKRRSYNAPHYIPNREKYGFTYYIAKLEKNK